MGAMGNSVNGTVFRNGEFRKTGNEAGQGRTSTPVQACTFLYMNDPHGQKPRGTLKGIPAFGCTAQKCSSWFAGLLQFRQRQLPINQPQSKTL